MTASPKVVAWEVVRYDRNDKESREVVLAPLTDDTVLDDGDEAFGLMRVEDHESALAGLREELQKQKSLNAGYQSTIALIEAKLATLLTGLEALAGELRKKEEDDEVSIGESIAYGEMADDILALVASAGLEGNGNG